MQIPTITPYAADEFSTLKKAIIYAGANPKPLYPLNDVAMQRGTKHIDASEFSRLADFLVKQNIELYSPFRFGKNVKSLQESFGGNQYCRDALGVIDGQAFLTNPPKFTPKDMERHESIFRQVSESQRHKLQTTWTWGNALLHEDTLLTGTVVPGAIPGLTADLHQKSKLVAAQQKGERQQIQEALDQHDISRTLVEIPLRDIDDIDCVLAPLPRKKRKDQRKALWLQNRFHDSARGLLKNHFDELIPVKDSFAFMPCNLLWINPSTVIVPTEAKGVTKLLKKLKYRVHNFSFAERIQIGVQSEQNYGGWRCNIGVLERGKDYKG